MKLSAIIFDMDGTIIDSREIVLGAFKHVLEEFGEVYDEATVSSHVGKLLEHTYEDLLPGHDMKAATDLHRSWQYDNRQLLKGYEGLDDFLDKLKSKGLKLGIFTSALRVRADLALDGLGIRQYFNAIVCGDEVANPKPDAEGVIKLSDALDTPLPEIIMVGDAAHDIGSGKNAGVVSIGITHGFGTKQAIEDVGADHIVDNLAELLSKIEELSEDGS